MGINRGKRDPYEVLGIQRGSGEGVVRSAFLSKAKAFHPDSNGGKGNPEAFNEARDALHQIMNEIHREEIFNTKECNHCGGTRKCTVNCSQCNFIRTLKTYCFSDQCAICV